MADTAPACHGDFSPGAATDGGAKLGRAVGCNAIGGLLVVELAKTKVMGIRHGNMEEDII